MCTCSIDRDISEREKWNLGGCMSGFPLTPNQVRLVLSLPVFAQPQDQVQLQGAVAPGVYTV